MYSTREMSFVTHFLVLVRIMVGEVGRHYLWVYIIYIIFLLVVPLEDLIFTFFKSYVRNPGV